MKNENYTLWIILAAIALFACAQAKAVDFYVGASIGLGSIQNTEKVDLHGTQITANGRVNGSQAIYGGIRLEQAEIELGLIRLPRLHIEAFNNGADGNGARAAVQDVNTR